MPDSIDEPAPPPPVHVPRWRWVVHLILLAAYPIVIGLIGHFSRSGTETAPPLLPGSVGPLIAMVSVELLLFSAVFAVAWFASRASPADLFLVWRGRLWPFLRGPVYSVALRIMIALLVVAIVGIAFVFKWMDEETLDRVRPQTEQVVDVAALTEDPVYFILSLTLVSFVVGGLREEMWRAGVIAGLAGVWPRVFGSRAGQFFGVFVAAVIFGLGHAPQGWGGVIVTSWLGIGLGVIMVYHRSIWDAVIAHGCFNATTFALLWVLAKFQPDLIKPFL